MVVSVHGVRHLQVEKEKERGAPAVFRCGPSCSGSNNRQMLHSY